MPVVSNPSADRQEKIDNAARILRASKLREQVFIVIYTGHKKYKKIEEIQAAIKNRSSRVYSAAAKLAAEDIIEKKSKGTTLFYGKIEFYTHNKNKILGLAHNKKRLDKFPTKHRPHLPVSKSIAINYSNRVRIQEIFAEDFNGFSRIKDVQIATGIRIKLSEKTIKEGFKKLLGEQSKTNDWGGEFNDIFTRTTMKNKRVSTAFVLKGPGTNGILTLRKMGKNGDQIVRLFKSPAEAFIVQYYGQIDPIVLDLMKSLAVEKSIKLNKKIYFGIIDGADTSKIIATYPEAFKL